MKIMLKTLINSLYTAQRNCGYLKMVGILSLALSQAPQHKTDPKLCVNVITSCD